MKTYEYWNAALLFQRLYISLFFYFKFFLWKSWLWFYPYNQASMSEA